MALPELATSKCKSYLPSFWASEQEFHPQPPSSTHSIHRVYGAGSIVWPDWPGLSPAPENSSSVGRPPPACSYKMTWLVWPPQKSWWRSVGSGHGPGFLVSLFGRLCEGDRYDQKTASLLDLATWLPATARLLMTNQCHTSLLSYKICQVPPKGFYHLRREPLMCCQTCYHEIKRAFSIFCISSLVGKCS